MTGVIAFGVSPAGVDVSLLGTLGNELQRLAELGVAVAPGFTITTDARPEQLRDELGPALAEVLAGGEHLLLGVYTSARRALPGCAPPLRNIGLGRSTLATVIESTGDAKAAYAAYAELVRSLARPLGVDSSLLAAAEHDVASERELVESYLEIVEQETGAPFPDQPLEQLLLAVENAQQTWSSPRAAAARRVLEVSDNERVAIHVLASAYGAHDSCARTRIASRDPLHGEPTLTGGVVFGGEALLADDPRGGRPLEELWQVMPSVRRQVEATVQSLERALRDAVDVELEVAFGQPRVIAAQPLADCRPLARVSVAVDLAQAGVIAETEAVLRIEARDLEHALHPRLALTGAETTIGTGLGASPGAACGRVCLSARRAEELSEAGESVILVKSETVPEDLPGMLAASGIVTTRGGAASHAAVIARGLGKPAVCGAQLEIDLELRELRGGGIAVAEGEPIAIDGRTGEVVVGEVAVVEPTPVGSLETLLGWADRHRRLRVRANADSAHDAHIARLLGAEGIGLCRTEHQFLGPRLPLIQRFILALDEDEEQTALAEIVAVLRDDFVALLEAMDGLPVTVRLLDPPLHEFLPNVTELAVAHAREEIDEVGKRMLVAARTWQEANPMLGTRGVRLALLKPGLYPAQARALLEAAAERCAAGGDPRVEIMVPLVVAGSEFDAVAATVRTEAEAVAAETGVHIDYTIGSMIETPRAALVAGEIARGAEFFSFGTNDLTQLTYGLSRDDVESRLLPHYLRENLIPHNPFQTIDREGVGALVELAIAGGRATRPDLKVGICGEHGGDPASIRLCHELGLDYVSCSPYRVPIARLAAAQATLEAVAEDPAL